MQPTRKVSAGALGGAAATVLVWGLRLAHIEVPGEVGAAFATICTFAASYLTPET